MDINSFFDWFFHSADIELFGNVGIMIIFIVLISFSLLMFFNANRFASLGFLAVTIIGLGYYGYTTVGWLAPLGALIGGLMLGLAIIKLIELR